MSQTALSHFHFLYRDNEQARTLFLLHGTGGNEADLLPLADPLNDRYNIVGLRGNVSENGMARFFARDARGVFDQASLAEEVQKLAEFLAAWYKQHENGVDDAVFVGYSNGANMILATALRHPVVVRQAALLHAMLPFEEASVDLSGGRFLVTYGEADPLIAAADSLRVVRALEARGAEVQVASHKGGHELAQPEIDALYEFLRTSA